MMIASYLYVCTVERNTKNTLLGRHENGGKVRYSGYGWISQAPKTPVFILGRGVDAVSKTSCEVGNVGVMEIPCLCIEK